MQALATLLLAFAQYQADRPVPPPAASPFSLQLNLDLTNAYFYHGVRQQDDSAVLQPAVELGVVLWSKDDAKVEALARAFGSYGKNRSPLTQDGWTQVDYLVGLRLTKERWSLTAQYLFLTSPGARTVDEIDLILAHDDLLHPHILVAFETSSVGLDSQDAGGYLELGIEPQWPLGEKDPVVLSFPVTVGFGLYDYYQDTAASDGFNFGYVQLGVAAAVPLPFGKSLGRWTLNAGAYELFLGEDAEFFNSGDESQFIGTVGLQVNF